MYFNSIKVQLELLLPISCTEVLPFQFHKGTIRTHKMNDKLRIYDNFNSIKVQLEPFSRDCFIFRLLFQFHKGTIRTRAHIHAIGD